MYYQLIFPVLQLIIIIINYAIKSTGTKRRNIFKLYDRVGEEDALYAGFSIWRPLNKTEHQFYDLLWAIEALHEHSLVYTEREKKIWIFTIK